MSVLSTKRRLVALALRRHGVRTAIERPTVGPTDEYGRPDYDTAPVASEYVFPAFADTQSNERTAFVLSSGISYNVSPQLLLRYDTKAREGDYLSVNGERFVIEAITRFDSHCEATTTLLDPPAT
jgi:hypothetical protein